MLDCQLTLVFIMIASPSKPSAAITIIMMEKPRNFHKIPGNSDLEIVTHREGLETDLSGFVPQNLWSPDSCH